MPLDVPAGVVTLTEPLVAVAGTVVVILESESTEKVVAATAPNLTALAPVKVVPVISTLAPRIPLAGLSWVTLGVTLKVMAPPAPAELVTCTGPMCAPAGTVAFTLVELTGVITLAAVPPKVTALTPARLEPEIVTTVPTAPEEGLSPDTLGGRMTV